MEKIDKNFHPLPGRRKKIYEHVRDSRPDRRKKKKSCTKAELKRRTRAHLAEAVKRIEIFNRIDILPEKRAHLDSAIAHLEAVLEKRGGNQLMRRQLACCREALWELERAAPSARFQQVEIVVDVD